METIIEDNNELRTRRSLAADPDETTEADRGAYAPTRNAGTWPDVLATKDAIPKAKPSGRKRKRASLTKFVAITILVTILVSILCTILVTALQMI